MITPLYDEDLLEYVVEALTTNKQKTNSVAFSLQMNYTD
jgi:hypothetical protein